MSTGLCLSCKKFNNVLDHEARRGYYKDGKYYEEGNVYDTCSGFPMWKGHGNKEDCHNYIEK